MARTFASASSQYAEVAGVSVSAYPYTMSAWFRATTLVNGAVFTQNSNTTASRWTAIGFTAAGVGYHEVNSVGAAGPASPNIAAVNTWVHLAGVGTSATSRTCYVRGVAGTANTTNTALAAMTHTTLGALNNGASRVSFQNGMIAEAAIWNVALNASEILSLSRAVNPLRVRRASLQFYCPVWGSSSPERDYTPGQRHPVLAAAGAAPSVSGMHVPIMPVAMDTSPVMVSAAAAAEVIPDLAMPSYQGAY